MPNAAGLKNAIMLLHENNCVVLMNYQMLTKVFLLHALNVHSRIQFVVHAGKQGTSNCFLVVTCYARATIEPFSNTRHQTVSHHDAVHSG